MIRVIFALIFLALPANISAAQQVPYGLNELSIDIAGLTKLKNASAAIIAADNIRAKLGMEPVPQVISFQDPPAFESSGNAVVELVDQRLFMTYVAAQTGSTDNDVLYAAQMGENPQAILLRGGNITWTKFLSLIAGTPAEKFVERSDDISKVMRPIVIWPDAGLSLEAGDNISLSAAHGAYIANLGLLNIDGAGVQGSKEGNLQTSVFRPFILTSGQGSFSAVKSNFSNLGFGKTQRFSGVSVLMSGLKPSLVTPYFEDNTFDAVRYVSIVNADSAVFRGNIFLSSSVSSASSDNLIIYRNLLLYSEAIRVANGSVGSKIIGNIAIGGKVAIQYDQGSDYSDVAYNLATGQISQAIQVRKSKCINIRKNTFLLGAGHGLSVQASKQVFVTNNIFYGHAGSAIVIRDQKTDSIIRITENKFRNNREAVYGATSGHILFSQNDFEYQKPRLFTGDLAVQTIFWLESQRSGVEIVKNTVEPVDACFERSGL